MQDAQQQGGQPPESDRYEQNLTEQEQAQMRQEMAEVDDNAPVRKNDPRTSVQKAEEYRFASNIPRDQTIPEKEYADYTLEYDEDDAVMNGKIPDVLLDVPVVKVDEINFELNDLRAKVNLFAKVLDLVELSVGVDAYLGRVKLVIKGVEAQALLKVRLDNVTAIIDRVNLWAKASIPRSKMSAKGPVSWSAKGPTRPSPTSARVPVISWEREPTRPLRTSVQAPARRSRTSVLVRATWWEREPTKRSPT
jgi:hypothetical protein